MGSRIEIDLHIVHHFYDGVYMKEMRLPEGHAAEKHVHDFTHQSVLLSGRAHLIVDADTFDLEGPVCITIDAGKVHTIIALSDCEWYCIHETDITDPDQINHTLIKGD